MNVHAVSPDMPRTRRECPQGPCHHVACRFHLWTDRVLDRDGAVVDLRETAVFGNRQHTCVLREIARGAKTLEAIGSLLDVSRERVRQIEAEALARLRDADPGVLRELLDAVSEIQSDGEPWEEDDLSAMPDPDVPDACAEDTDATDDTGLPDGADDPATDDTGTLPWSEPTYTDDANTESFKASHRRLRRATEQAIDAHPYWCPHCGRTYPGVTIHGTKRRGCPNPRCARLAQGARNRREGLHRRPIAPEVVAAIRSEYRPGERGYKVLAREFGVSRRAVQDIVLGRTYREAC